MNATRRSLFCAAIPAAILAGCTAAQAQSTLQTLAAGWATLPGLLSGAGVTIPAATLSQVNAAVADLESKATQIGTTVSAPPTKVSALTSDITLVSSLLSPFYPASTAIGLLVNAGVSLIGTLLSEAGVAAATLNAPAPPMTPAAALLILRGAAAK